MMWVVLAFASAALLGCYDFFKKVSLKDNSVVAVLFLIIGVIGGLYLFVISMDVAGHIQSSKLLFESILTGPLFFCLVGLLPWAGIKTVVNISRNLHAIREELQQLRSRN